MRILTSIPVFLLLLVSFTTNAQLKFIENKGQLSYTNGQPAADVLFYADAGNVRYMVRKTGLTYILSNPITYMNGQPFVQPGEPVEGKPMGDSLLASGWRVDMNWINSNPVPKTRTENQLRHKQNYYTPRFPNGLIGVRSFERVTLENVFNGIDVVFYSQNNQLKYDYIVRNGMQYEQIAFKFEGAEEVKFDKSQISLKVQGGVINDFIPESYGIENGKKVKIDMQYVQDNKHVFTYQTKQKIDRFSSFVIDPAVWITYFGGSGYEYPYDIEVNEKGETFMTGLSASSDMPVTPGAFQTGFPFAVGSSPYICKFQADGSLEWSTFYSGTLYEESNGICVDTVNHHVYISGFTYSADFPTTAGSWQPALMGTNADVFVLKFNEDGTRVWATFLGGSVFDVGTKCDVDNSGNVWVTGSSSSSADWPLVSPYDGTYGGGGNDVILAKFSPACVLLYSTYLGGALEEKGIDIDFTTGFIGVTGNSRSVAFPVTADAYDATTAGTDGFYTKLNLAGNVVYSTFMGGGALDLPQSISYNKLGEAIVSGRTGSADFPTSATALQPAFGGGTWDVFMVKFKTDNTVDWSTYYGTANSEAAAGTAIDPDNQIYLVTTLADLPPMEVFNCAFQKTTGGDKDLYITKFTTGCSIICKTYLGGPGEDNGDISGAHIEYHKRFLHVSAYVSDLFPVTGNTSQPAFGGYYDAAVAKICSIACGDTLASFANYTFSDDSVCVGLPVEFVADGVPCDNSLVTYNWSFPGGTPSSSTLQSPTIVYGVSGAFTATLTVRSPCDTTVKIVNIFAGNFDALTSVITADVDSICSGQTVNITSVVSGGTAPFEYTWSTSPSDTLSTVAATPTSSGYIYFSADNATSCPGIDSVYITVLPIANLNAPDDTCICPGTNLVLTATGAPSYLWNTGATTASIGILPDSNFTYVVTYSNGICADSDSTVVCIYPAPFVAASADTSVEYPNPATITVIGSGPFTWDITTGLDCDTCNTTTAMPAETTTYTVTVTNAQGCTASDAVTVTVTYALTIPNIITPNADGLNDVFYIDGLPPESKIDIFNRWGNLMYHSDNYTNNWSIASDGVYYYVLTITGGKSFKGFLHITTSK
ncbi:MAG TPA: gliding motility-associated C-terminal domain-containing protein [Flavobacteriales bacterium]|nr:gliding motility-associated C-terminal domain-containing protein [Flavobacteriales bacterium]